MSSEYDVTYWGDDNSTKVKFEEFHHIPNSAITACFVAAFDENGLLAIAKPNRGWGLPGGHVEAGESPIECVHREAKEECGIEVSNLSVIGGWRAEKVKETEVNTQYPKLAYQLLYIGKIKIKDKVFVSDYEISECFARIIYRDYSAIAEQLKSRKGLILKRSAFASGPLIVALAILTNLQKLLDSFGAPHDQIGMTYLVTTAAMIFVAMP